MLQTIIEERNTLVQKTETLEQERQDLLKVVHTPEAEVSNPAHPDASMNPQECTDKDTELSPQSKPPAH